MITARSLVIAGLVCGLSFAAPAKTAQAQSIFERALDRAERSVERRAERRLSASVEAALDRVENGVVCAVTDQNCIDGARNEGRPVVLQDADGELVEVRDTAQHAGDAPATPGEGVWANYDFVPGDRILFYEDFSAERVGRFPRRLEFLGGMMDVVEWEGRRLLQSTDTSSMFRVSLGETLPERFTIEFDAYISGSITRSRLGVFTTEMASPDRWDHYDGAFFALGRADAGVQGPIESTRARTDYRDRLTPIRIAVDGNYATMYVEEERVANIPNMQLVRNDFLTFVLGGRSEQPSYIGNLRIAAGGLELYDRLMADGRVSTQGIYFDTGSAAIRPESTGTLTEIGWTLEQHPGLRVRIEGHTDSVGDAQANLQLSEQRARAVMDYLVSGYGIAAERLEFTGRGEEAPVADNATAEGRQANRRVELVRL
ncbi:MAG: OmpA family protein [Gammaproteobacteria bacterium]|nr:OmpA family protein [Gammaproteobacteria bacterium]